MSAKDTPANTYGQLYGNNTNVTPTNTPYYTVQDVVKELTVLTEAMRNLNEGPERSRALSLAITAAEECEDKLYRKLRGE